MLATLGEVTGCRSYAVLGCPAVHRACIDASERANLSRRVDDSLKELSAALEAEREAAKQLRRARAHLGALIDQAVASGVQYGVIAREALRLRLGHAPTVHERLREMQRLRQRRRRAVTGGHANLKRATTSKAHPPVGSTEEVRAMNEKLVKRITTVEEFVNDDVKTKDCAEDVELDEKEDEGDDAE